MCRQRLTAPIQPFTTRKRKRVSKAEIDGLGARLQRNTRKCRRCRRLTHLLDEVLPVTQGHFRVAPLQPGRCALVPTDCLCEVTRRFEVLCQQRRLLVERVCVQLDDRPGHRRMHPRTTLAQLRGQRNLLRERMPELVLRRRVDRGLVQELCLQQRAERGIELACVVSRTSCSKRLSKSRPITAAVRSTSFSRSPSRSMRAARISCTVDGRSSASMLCVSGAHRDRRPARRSRPATARSPPQRTGCPRCVHEYAR